VLLESFPPFFFADRIASTIYRKAWSRRQKLSAFSLTKMIGFLSAPKEIGSPKEIRSENPVFPDTRNRKLT
jgi:hypothetical protein